MAYFTRGGRYPREPDSTGGKIRGHADCVLCCSPTPANATMDELLGLQRQMTDFVDQLKAITPGSGCYLNEVYIPFPFQDYKRTDECLLFLG